MLIIVNLLLLCTTVLAELVIIRRIWIDSINQFGLSLESENREKK
jgi:hypothetical protein